MSKPLRAVKSLPSLRSQASHFRNEPLPSLPSHIITRNVHKTSTAQTTIFGGSSNKFTVMNLQGLRLECKRRGLKVGGRKLELVQRLSHFEDGNGVEKPAQRQISSTATANAKGDSSHIDEFKFPMPNYPDELPPTKVPSLSTKASLKQTEQQPDKSSVADIVSGKVGGIVSVPVGSTAQVVESGQEIDNFFSKSHEEEEFHDYGYVPPHEGLSNRDKGFLGGLAAFVGVWWTLKPKEDKK